MKLKELGVLWIDESEIYVADIGLFSSAADFLKAVIAHIQVLIDGGVDYEAGWFDAPNFEENLPRVTNQCWMAHRLNHDYEWEMQTEPGPGNRKVWVIDFEAGVKE